MAVEFRQFMQAELDVIVREIGADCLGNTQLANIRAADWINRNAERFRVEWDMNHVAERDSGIKETGIAG